MAKNNEIKWLEQRFVLMQVHLQELKELFREQRKATQVIRHDHQLRQRMVAAEDKATMVKLVNIYGSQLTELSIKFGQQRSLILARHRQEELAQQARIDQEKRVVI